VAVEVLCCGDAWGVWLLMVWVVMGRAAHAVAVGREGEGVGDVFVMSMPSAGKVSLGLLAWEGEGGRRGSLVVGKSISGSAPTRDWYIHRRRAGM
jgi:hypothetical protein